MTKPQTIIYGLSVCLFAAIPFAANSQTKPVHTDKTWVLQSNKYTEELINLDKKYTPEYGSSQGLSAYDTLIVVLTLANELAERKEGELLALQYKAALQAENNISVKQDLNILISHLNMGSRIRILSTKEKYLS